MEQQCFNLILSILLIFSTQGVGGVVTSEKFFVSCENYTRVLREHPSQQDFHAIGNLSGEVLTLSLARLMSEGAFCKFRTMNVYRYEPGFLEDLGKFVGNSSEPSVGQFLTRTYTAFTMVYEEYPTLGQLKEMYYHWYLLMDNQLFPYITMMTIIISLVRYLLTKFFLRPYCDSLQLPERDHKKLISSMWLTIASICLWLHTLNVVILSGRRDFFEPLTILSNIRFDIGFFTDSLPTDYFWLYTIQISYYVSEILSMYLSSFCREDRGVITIHHFVTISLLFISYNTKLHVIGSITLLLHDINDIFLELGKVNVYLKFKHKKYNPINDTLATICYIFFMASWTVTRLYWFPLKVLYASSWGAYITHVGREIFFFYELNILLWSLFGLHIYWTYLIVNLAFKILTGRMKNLGDIRETDIDFDKNPEDVLKTITKKKE